MIGGPIVEARGAVFHSLPLQPVGRTFSMVETRARRFSSSFCSSNSHWEAREESGEASEKTERGGGSWRGLVERGEGEGRS